MADLGDSSHIRASRTGTVYRSPNPLDKNGRPIPNGVLFATGLLALIVVAVAFLGSAAAVGWAGEQAAGSIVISVLPEAHAFPGYYTTHQLTVPSLP